VARKTKEKKKLHVGRGFGPPGKSRKKKPSFRWNPARGKRLGGKGTRNRGQKKGKGAPAKPEKHTYWATVPARAGGNRPDLGAKGGVAGGKEAGSETGTEKKLLKLWHRKRKSGRKQQNGKTGPTMRGKGQVSRRGSPRSVTGAKDVNIGVG